MTAPSLNESRPFDPHRIEPERRRRPRAPHNVRRHAPPTTVRPSLGAINRLVRAMDAVAAAAVFAVVTTVERGGVGSPIPGLLAALACGAVYVAVVGALGGYRVERYRRWRLQAVEMVVASIAALAVGLIFIAVTTRHAPHDPAALLVALPLAVVAGRMLSAGVIAALRRRGLLRRRVAIVGATQIGEHIVERLRRPEHHRSWEFAGLYEDRSDARPRTARGPVAGDLAALRLLAQTSRVDVIVLALPWRDAEGLIRLGERVQSISADIVTPLDDPGFLARSSLVADIAGLPTLQLTRHPFRGTQGLAKLMQDYLVAGAALVLVAPVMMAAALAIRLSDEGPILFRQSRIGFNGRPFSIYKFRSMSVDPADDGSGVARRDNPRVTRIGALLRRTSIDELPQLFNVLRGEMSIVGPRPHVARMSIGDGLYEDRVRNYAARRQIKPGITGWAQINGMRGGIDSLDKARRGADLDLHYMRNWSLQLDLRIILRTVVLHMAGPEVF